MKRTQQFSFSGPRMKSVKAYGGTLRRKNFNRGSRPLSTKHPLHLVFKSSMAKGVLSFLRPQNRKILQRTLDEMAGRYGLRIVETGICGNHFHLLVRFQNRRFLIHFLRAFAGTLVKRLMAVHGREFMNQTHRFFDFRPFSRVVESFKGYRVARDYVILNQLEGLGIIPYQSERTRSSWWRSRTDF